MDCQLEGCIYGEQISFLLRRRGNGSWSDPGIIHSFCLTVQMSTVTTQSPAQLEAAYNKNWTEARTAWRRTLQLHREEKAAPDSTKQKERIEAATKALRAMEASYDCCLQYPLGCGIRCRAEQASVILHFHRDASENIRWQVRRLATRKTGVSHTSNLTQIHQSWKCRVDFPPKNTRTK